MADTPDRTNQTREVCYKESMEASSKKDTPGAVEDENTPSTSRVTSASGVNAKTFTVTRTTTITDRAGNVVQESSVSQDVESHISGEQENDFIAELVALGWTPKGRPNPPSSTVPKPPPPPPPST